MQQQPLSAPAVAIPFAGSPSSASPLPDALNALLSAHLAADAAIQNPALEAELKEGTAGPHVTLALSLLRETIAQAIAWKSKTTGRKITAEEDARGTWVHAWALGRVGEYDGTTPELLPGKLEEALAVYQKAADLLQLPPPPMLDEAPSVTRPSDKVLALVLPEQPAWVGEFLAEWARTQTTLAFSKLVLRDEVIEENNLATLLEMSCRRNVAALFTPLLPSTESDDPNPSEASTVLGNARLIKDVSTMFPFSSSPTLWTRRIQWATHVADVQFVEASMNANRLIDAASASASILQKPGTSPEKRTEVRKVLESTLRHLVPFEKTQGVCLLSLGKVMLAAIGTLYLGVEEQDTTGPRRRDESRDSHVESDNGVAVPENELVRETRQVLIRAAGLFENAYASFRRSPVHARTSSLEKKILRRLESTYCLLEELDNDTPEVVELRAQRVERALWINDRLIALGDEDESSGEEDDEMAKDSDDDDPIDSALAQRLGRHGLED